jgi:hypothetical protein
LFIFEESEKVFEGVRFCAREFHARRVKFSRTGARASVHFGVTEEGKLEVF